MDPQMTSYLSKLVSHNEKDEDRRKYGQKPLNHERTKSYADILVVTPSNSKPQPEKGGHSYRASHASADVNPIFFSLGSTPTSQRPSAKPTESARPGPTN
jgi:hypothetical protein